MIGLALEHISDNKQPGTIIGSVGYRSDSKLFTGDNVGIEYGEHFEENDVIGCGIFLDSYDIFFTKNGKNLGNINKKLLKVIPNIIYKYYIIT